jgi:hypothetical protein
MKRLPSFSGGIPKRNFRYSPAEARQTLHTPDPFYPLLLKLSLQQNHLYLLLAIKNINLKCVEYFLENILPDMVKEETPSSIDIKKISFTELKPLP